MKHGPFSGIVLSLGFVVVFSVVFIQLLGVAGLPLGVAVGLAIGQATQWNGRMADDEATGEGGEAEGLDEPDPRR